MMNITLFTLFFCLSSFATPNPQVLARYAVNNSWNAPQVLACFSSEPWVEEGKVYLGCFDDHDHYMVEWAPKFKIIAKTGNELNFSHPLGSPQGVSWHEFDEAVTKNAFTLNSRGLTKIEVHDLGATNDSFLPLGNNTYIYRLKLETPELWMWVNGVLKQLFKADVLHLFPPVTDQLGNILLKTRSGVLTENGADKLWIRQGTNWKVLLQDHDSDPSSKWKSFRHQYSLDNGQVLFIAAADDRDEALYLWNGSRLKELARAGRDLKSFDFFTPKLRGNTVAFRGVDFENRKAVWVYQKGSLKKLITQGDIVSTDIGPGKIHYSNQDAIFYGAPGIGPQGEIVIQATLTKPDDVDTLLGVSLLKYHNKQ